MSNLGDRLIKSSKEAAQIVKCDHAFVMTPEQPRNPQWVRVFCPRCEGTFTISRESE